MVMCRDFYSHRYSSMFRLVKESDSKLSFYKVEENGKLKKVRDKEYQKLFIVRNGKFHRPDSMNNRDMTVQYSKTPRFNQHPISSGVYAPFEIKCGGDIEDSSFGMKGSVNKLGALEVDKFYCNRVGNKHTIDTCDLGVRTVSNIARKYIKLFAKQIDNMKKAVYDYVNTPEDNARIEEYIKNNKS